MGIRSFRAHRACVDGLSDILSSSLTGCGARRQEACVIAEGT